MSEKFETYRINEPNIYREMNYSTISGVLEDEFTYSHTSFEKNFYKNRVMIARNSGTIDYLPIIVPESLIPNGSSCKKWIEITGSLRSINKMGEDGHNHLEIFIYPYTLCIYETQLELKESVNVNKIYLNGYICQEPIRRITPFNRIIADFMIAVKRAGKSQRLDHIPCIAWGKNANWISTLKKGEKIKLYGRLQSRDYFKRQSPDSEEGEYKTTYELSVSRIEKEE